MSSGRRRALGRLARLAAASVAAAGSAGLAGCASAPMGQALRRAPPPGLPPRAWLRETPHVPDDDTLCGPAVLAAMLAAAGRPVGLAALTPRIYLPGRRGTLQAEMLAGARRHGRLAVVLPPTLEAALREVAGGHPVAALVNLSLPAWPRWHYVVLTGYDLAAGTARVHSGVHAHQAWSLTALERTWARGGHWAFVVLPPGELPAAAGEAAVLEALLALDRAAAPADAAPAWAAAARRWPDSLTAAMGEGNAWMAAGQDGAAAAAFERAARRFDSAAAWNNLAQTELRRGRPGAARVAAERALARAQSAEPQWLEAARRTLAAVDRAAR